MRRVCAAFSMDLGLAGGFHFQESLRTSAHACLKSTHNRLNVLRRVGYRRRGGGSATQLLSPTFDIGRPTLRRKM